MPAALNDHLEMRPATIDDLENLVAIRIAAMRESLERVGRFQPQRARERLTGDFQADKTRCLLVNKTLVGFLVVDHEDDEMVIKHLYVLPEMQNRGIGSFALAQVIAQAQAERLPIRLITLKESRANDFYRRHGFQQMGSSDFDNLYIRPWEDQ